MHLYILLIVLPKMVLVSGDRCKPIGNHKSPLLLYVDDRNRKAGCPTDTFFDRLIAIGTRIKDLKRIASDPVITTGVIVTKNLVLTSFNPYRKLSRMDKDDLLPKFHSFTVLGRLIKNGTDATIYSYNMNTLNFTCARQVVPDFDIEPPSHMRHGIHSPLHDLMVMRLGKDLKFLDPIPKREFSFNTHPKTFNTLYRVMEWANQGQIKTILAKQGDEIGDEIYFASIGHRDRADMRQNRYLYREIYDTDDRVITDCDEWFPREWGYFICVLNVDNFPGIASGGMLFSDEKLFGVASFALFKGAKGILVFTDVRPYWHLIHETCTDNDTARIVPPPPPTTSDPYYTDD